jgi:hypothetical protein
MDGWFDMGFMTNRGVGFNTKNEDFKVFVEEFLSGWLDDVCIRLLILLMRWGFGVFLKGKYSWNWE